jgi:hypothetical protein
MQKQMAKMKQEKEEERIAREKIKAQIEADKLARLQKVCLAFGSHWLHTLNY